MFKTSRLVANGDALQVEEAAAILEVSEYRLFELAYQDWFGVLGKDTNLESAYMPYVMCGTVPCWLRHFSRKTLKLCDEAGLFLPNLSARSNTISSALKSIEVWSFVLFLSVISMMVT